MAWSAEQISNAKAIINVGQQLGASGRDIQTALMAAIVESGLRNLNYGDRDSIGLFQQRNAWGSKADRLDPAKAARMFFLGGADGQRGLLDFQSRNSWDMGYAAQKVQVSAYPDRYGQHEEEGGLLLKELGGSAGNTPTNPQSKPTVSPTVDLDQTQQTLTGTERPATALSALGVDSPTSTGVEAAGADAATMPGIESADQAPKLPQMDEMPFLPSSTGEPGGVAGSFEDTFPKGPIQGGVRQRAVDIARTALGVPYVWGGNDLKGGVDCSGFVQQVYKQLGINLPRISAAQARAGNRVGLNQLQVGDLVGWDNSSRNNGAVHVLLSSLPSPLYL